MVMRVKKAWRKSKRRELGHTLGRFLAILSIVALGVGFFSGLKVTKNAMIDTADQYLRQNEMFDEKIMTTLGIDKSQVDSIAAMDGVAVAEGAVSQDVLATLESGASYVLAAHSITTEVNLLKLTAGRMPIADNECLGDARMLPKSAIGSKLLISKDNDQDTLDAFTYDTYNIVGLVDSPTYLNMERGTTKLAGGKITAYLYVPEGGFSRDYYTELYVRLTGADQKIFSDAYDQTVARMEDPLKERMKLLANEKYQDIVDKANKEIADAEQKYRVYFL